MCLLGLGTVVISRITNNKRMHRSDTFTLPAHEGRGEYIAMSFMCAGSHEISFFISTCYHTNFLCVRKTKRSKLLNIRNNFVEAVALVHGKRKVTG